ncbi:penicillin-binding protein 1A [Apibacter sp. HY039]|uniref:penicillin-binding protein 1A n=1 Tax=Apibacter sp. HY039 TaxID=2501476 RepID=UPI000FEB6AE5|nr:transglycosylase domain-containing protein [Apibacter sp. HY039]
MESTNKTNNSNKGVKQLNSRKKFIKKFLLWFWGLFFCGLLALVLLFVLTIYGVFGEMPNVRELENPDIYVASEIISSDGVVIQKFEKEKRIPVEFQDLPQTMVYALMAKEDERFPYHSGVDKKALFRAIVYRGTRGGGSTITQQLAKLLFTQREDEDGKPSYNGVSSNKIGRAFQKIKEIIIAVQLERLYTKDEIITLYLNKFDFLYNANGVATASRVYFNKDVKDLSLSESATLVAMLENPVVNNPKINPENAKKRRNVVLSLMKEQKYISQADFDSIKETPVKIDYRPVKEIGEGYSAYFKYALKREVRAILSDYEKQTGKSYNLYKDGLKIYVTLDSRMQKYAEEAIEKHVKYLQNIFFKEQKGRKYAPFYTYVDQRDKPIAEVYNSIMVSAMKRTQRYKFLKNRNLTDEQIIEEFKKPIELQIFTWKGDKDTIMSPWDSIRYHKHIVQAGLMAMEPHTGNIKAWVGGVNWKHFQYDHVKQARRQVGSTFKPFVYATAIKNINYTPCTQVSNATYTKGNWTVYGNGAMMTLKSALAFSKNAVTARLIDATGADAVIQMAKDLGVESPIPRNNTIALGSADLTIYEMVGAYSTFANYGNYTKPEMIWRIEDNNGKVIKEYEPQIREVMNEIYAYTMIDLMKGVVDIGTGRRVRGMGIKAEIAGKTGTTNKNADGWFIGIAPKLATGVWVGWEDRYAHFASTSIGQGSSMALPIWGYFMQKVYADKKLAITQEDKFEKPESIGNNFSCDDLASYGDYDGGYSGQRYYDIQEEVDNVPTPAVPETVNTKLKKKDSVNFDK